MPLDSDEFDFFVSYARADDVDGWITRFVEELLAEQRRLSGRALTCFFDRTEIRGLDDWRIRIYDSLAKSRLFVAFISPRYFASEWCRREWRAWIEVEIAKHIMSSGVAAVYIVCVPGLLGAQPLREREVAERIAALCEVAPSHDQFLESATPLIGQLRRRQLTAVEEIYDAGVDAIGRDDSRGVLAQLAQDLDQRAAFVQAAAESISTVPPYNKRFSGRVDELLALRERLLDDRAGVICGVHGLGGIGKTEVAFTYAQAFAGAYPGGRFLVSCEGKTSLQEATLQLGDLFLDRITDNDRKNPASYFAAIAASLSHRIEQLGHILLVLDNVTELGLVSRQETDSLTCLGPKLHILATSRLAPPAGDSWLTLGELPERDATELLEKHRPFPNEIERAAAQRIVRRLGGFALAVELVAAWLLTHPATTYAQLVDSLGLEDLEVIAESESVELRRHNHERRLSAVLGPVLDGLDAAELRTMEYAAILPPDNVPLSWLKVLVTRDFPELGHRGRLSDPWDDLFQQLFGLALLSRPEAHVDQRVVRMHRLIQELMRHRVSRPELSQRQARLTQLVHERDDELRRTSQWNDARWELEPLDALANLWYETQNPEAAWLLNQVGVRWQHLGEWTRAEPVMRRALALDESICGPQHPNIARDLNNLGMLLSQTNRLAESEPLLRRAVAMWSATLGQYHPNVAAAFSNLAMLLKEMNRLAEAEPLSRWALAIDMTCHGPDHPTVAVRLDNLAQLLKDMKRPAEAEPLMRQALAILENFLGANHPDVAITGSNLALLLKGMNRAEEAETLLRKALTIAETSFGGKHPNVAIALDNLGGLLRETNRYEEAELLLRRALAVDEASYGPHHPNVAVVLTNLAQVLKATNRHAEAEPMMRRALSIFEASLSEDHPNVVTARNNLSQLLSEMER